ncbi:MAG: cache domain-containing protein [Candidatus Brocadia sp.]|nr:cache domain-containing protein [Candidatus Brocadia sp.]
MERKSSQLTQLRVSAITLFVLLIAFGAYYAFYVSSQKTYFTNRNFRLLADAGNQIRLKIENLHTVLNNAADIVVFDKGNSKKVKEVLDLVPDLKLLNDPSIEKINPVTGLFRELGWTPLITREENVKPAISLNVKQEEETFWVYFDYTGGADSGRIRIRARSNFLNKLIEPFFSRKVFDAVILAEEDGKVIFQRISSELRVVTLETLINKEGKEINFKSINSSTSLRDVRLAGANYKLFLQPVQLSLSAGVSQGDEKILKWTVCGLVRSHRFISESLAISYTIMVGFIFLVLIAILGLPFIKLWFMGLKDRLRMSDICFLVFSALAGSALLTLVLLDAYIYVDLGNKSDAQLKAFSDEICKNFKEEVKDVLKELRKLSDNELENDLKEPDKVSFVGEANIMGGRIQHNDPYPYFDMAAWIDSAGMQRIKRSVKGQTTQFISVSSRDYFKNAKEGRLWEIKDGKDRFSLEPIYSWNTGENTVIISMRISELNPPWIASINVRLLSLMQTILPPGFGYCVIEDNGKALFHSDETRNLRENFFEECDNDRLLRSAVFGHAKEWVNAPYLGRDHRLYVRPIDAFPWSLIVYQDKQIPGTINLDIISISAVLFALYALGLLIFLTLFYLLNFGNRAWWLCPNEDQAGNYNLLVIINLFLIAVLFGGILITQGWQIIVCAIVPPYLGMVLGFLILRKCPMPGRWNLFPYRLGYICMLFSLFILIGVLPMVAFLKVAYDEEMKLFVKHGQIKLVMGVEERADRVHSHYSKIKIGASDTQNTTNIREKQNEFIRKLIEKRLSLTWDIYAVFFFDTNFDTEPENQCHLNETKSPAGYFGQFLTGIRPLFYNQTCIELHELTSDASADELWQWEKTTKLSLHKKRYTRAKGAGDNILHISSVIPVLEVPTCPLWWIGLIGILTILFFTIRSVVQRVFLFNVEEPLDFFREDLGFEKVSQNLLVLGSPFTRKSEILTRGAFCLIDLRAIAKENGWSETFKYEEILADKNRIIAIDHFEYKMNDPRCNLEKLQFLEELFTFNRIVVIASSVEPAYFCFNTEIQKNRKSKAGTENSQNEQKEQFSPQDKDRWEGVFNSFLKVYIEDVGDSKAFQEKIEGQRRIVQAERTLSATRLAELFRVVEEECNTRAYLQNIGEEIAQKLRYKQFTPKQLMQQISDLTCSYYRAIWAICSPGERLTLFQIAQDRFLSPKNPDVLQLMRRGLVVRDPHLRLMNETFRRFALSACHTEDIIAWRKGAVSRWNTIKSPLMVILIAVAVFLFLTQRELYTTTIASVSAFAAGIPVLFKLFGLFQRGRAGTGTEA